MTESETTYNQLQRLIDYGKKLKESTTDPRKNIDSWLPSVKSTLPRNYLGRITRLNLISSKRTTSGQPNYRIVGPNIDAILALLQDEMVKLKNDNWNDREFFALRIIKARENSDNLEEIIAVIICGENPNFPNDIYLDIRNFFFNLGHNPFINHVNPEKSTADFLMTLDSLQLLDLVQYGLFNRKYYQTVNEKDGERSLDLKALQKASEDFNLLLDELSVPSEPVSLSHIFSVNQTYDLMFYTDYETTDAPLNLLLEEARRFFLTNEYQIAIEKLWDAFERMKTVLDGDKIIGASKLIGTMAIDIEKSFVTEEFKTLKEVGNDYTIRHHETSKITLTSDVEKRYLYFRMLSLLDYALQSMKSQK